MESELVLEPGILSSLLVNGEPADACPAESEPQTMTQQGGEESAWLEPGEIPPSQIKRETTAPDPFLLPQFGSNEHDVRGVDSFVHVPVTTTQANSLDQSEPRDALSRIHPPITAIQRRNHSRLSDIVTRLQNFDGSVTELLAIASIQQQIDAAFVDLDRAKNQLKQVFRQFELQGHINPRQFQKKNGATKELTKAAQRIAQLTKELFALQRRG
ncbi:hypothetical protein F5Y14DRAFT_405490 [Nemania sp. NC0429]|nr:hypothetical protein F5Y14DRAFT_405490 [Nemania sp. NC0429]